jgi:electron transfer flavoprotein alpha subunit
MKTDPETNRLLREGVPGVVNPYDAYALEMAARIKDGRPGARITALSMGPRQAESGLRQCLAAGADRACLVSGSAFGGSDTLATSYALSKAIEFAGPFDLILCGRQAIDGDTAQTGPELAERLNVPQVTLAKEIHVGGGVVRAVRETPRGTEIWASSLPAVITVTKPDFEPRCPTLGAKLAAKRAAVRVLSMEDIGAEPASCGWKGSPTVVRKTFAPPARGGCVFARDADELAGLLLRRLASNEKPKETAAFTAAACDTADVWVWLETPGGSAALVNEGRRIAGLLKTGVTAVALGHGIGSAVDSISGADRIIYADEPAFAEYNAEAFTAAMHRLVEKYRPEAMLFPASCNGRDFAPRLACRLRTGLTADCTGLDVDTRTGRVQWIRPAFSGNLMAVVECPEARPQMGTVRLAGSGGQAAEAGGAAETIREPMAGLPEPRARLVARLGGTGGGDPLAGAEVIVAAGRGMGGAGNIPLLRDLADALGAAVATSRAAADAGWLPRSCQVGQTGAVVSPKLYIACGISGAAQHLAGVSGAVAVVAVNSDPDAPIFRAADYGIVGDVREVLPAMAEAVRRGNV